MKPFLLIVVVFMKPVYLGSTQMEVEKMLTEYERSNSWETAQKEILRLEGGFQNDPDDRGNWTGGVVGVGENNGTNWGISAATYPNEDIKNMTKERALQLYKRDFWTPLKCDLMPAEIALLAFDFAVNSGLGTAKKFVKEASGYTGASYDLMTAEDFKFVDVFKLLAIRYEYYLRISHTSKYKKYRKGWLARLSNLVDKVD